MCIWRYKTNGGVTMAVTNILIVGVGGQGTLLTSRILAQAAINMGHDVKVSEIHGMAQRGGSVVTQVRYGDQVYAPIIQKGTADILLAFEKLEAARLLDYLRPNGQLIVNDEQIDPLPVLSGKAKYPTDILTKMNAVVKNMRVVKASKIAEDIGNRKAANVVMVGLLAKVAEFDKEVVKEALAQLVPPKTMDINLAAFEAGYQQ